MRQPITIREVETQLQRNHPGESSRSAWMLLSFSFGEADPWTTAEVNRGGVPLPYFFTTTSFDNEPTLPEKLPGEVRWLVHLPEASRMGGPGDQSANAQQSWGRAIDDYYPAWRSQVATTASAELDEPEAEELAAVVRVIREREVPASVRAALSIAGFSASDGYELVDSEESAIDVRATSAFGEELVHYDGWVHISCEDASNHWRGPAEHAITVIQGSAGLTPRDLIAALHADE